MIYFVPTPIGNLEDISQRSLNLLMRVEYIFCEDTRETKKLLNLLSNRYNLTCKPKIFTSFHSHNENTILHNMDIQSLHVNDHVFVSDAGMPCISDPGAKMVKFCQENKINYEVLAGANALLLAYASSGFLDTGFSFFGFLPHKGKQREDMLKNVLDNFQNSILYESPHRIIKLLEEIAIEDEDRNVFLIKEATKMYEKKFFGNIKKVLEEVKQANSKGEWVVIIEKNQNKTQSNHLHVSDILSLDIKPKEKSRLLAKITGENLEFWYKKLCNKE